MAMKEHRVTLVVVAPEGADINMKLYYATKHSELDYWIEGEPVATDYEGEE